MEEENMNDWHTMYAAFRQLHRDSQKGWVMGVCAGLATRFNLNIMVLRAIALISLFLFTLPTVLLYGLAALLMRDRPMPYYGPEHERKFWRSHSRGHGRMGC